MQINLRQREIETALKMYLQSQGINIKDKDISIDFTAGRKDSGLSAEISICDFEDTDKAMCKTTNLDKVKEVAPDQNSEVAVEASGGPKPVSLFK